MGVQSEPSGKVMLVWLCLLLFHNTLQAESKFTNETWTRMKDLFWKLFVESEFSVLEVGECLELAAHLLMDHESTIAQQAKRLVDAEHGDEKDCPEAMFVSLYGNPEEEERRRIRREAQLQEKNELLTCLWESLQMEYFLYQYRKKCPRKGREDRRRA